MAFKRGNGGGGRRGWDSPPWTPTKGRGTTIPPDMRFRSTPDDDQIERPGAPGPVGVGQRVQALFPPHIFPPFNAAHFFAADNATIGAGPVVTKFTGTSAKITIPQGNMGVVRELTFYVNGLLTTSVISFAVLVNGNPQEGYTKILMPQSAQAFFVFSPDNVFIPAIEQGTIEVQATVTDAVAYALGFELRGWSYSKEIAKWWSGAAG